MAVTVQPEYIHLVLFNPAQVRNVAILGALTGKPALQLLSTPPTAQDRPETMHLVWGPPCQKD